MKLALSEDLIIGGKGVSVGGVYIGVIFDDCNFYEMVNLD